MPSHTVVLVACVGAKLDHPAPAADLYVSDWFRKARAYAEAHGDLWYILSAKHALLKPDEVVAPYEMTLNALGAWERQRWASVVVDLLAEWLDPDARIVILAGERYRENVEPWLRAEGYDVEVPMRGLGIGQQLAWLKSRTPAERAA